MAITLKCPACEEKFKWKFSQQDKWPDYCPNCGTFMGITRADDDIVMPAILGPKTRATDGIYRQMEVGADYRHQLAAETLGVPKSELNDMKITNMNDRNDAEIAAPKLTGTAAELQNIIEANPTRVGFGANGAGYSSLVGEGAAPNMGAKTQSVVRERHYNLTGGTAVGDRPALETLNPGYRRRV